MAAALECITCCVLWTLHLTSMYSDLCKSCFVGDVICAKITGLNSWDGINALEHHWEKCIILDGYYVKRL